MKKERYICYENESREVYTISELHKIFDTEVDEEQKENGTTFDLWLAEMIKMQILILAND